WGGRRLRRAGHRLLRRHGRPGLPPHQVGAVPPRDPLRLRDARQLRAEPRQEEPAEPRGRGAAEVLTTRPLAAWHSRQAASGSHVLPVLPRFVAFPAHPRDAPHKALAKSLPQVLSKQTLVQEPRFGLRIAKDERTADRTVSEIVPTCLRA